MKSPVESRAQQLIDLRSEVKNILNLNSAKLYLSSSQFKHYILRDKPTKFMMVQVKERKAKAFIAVIRSADDQQLFRTGFIV